MGKLIEFPKRVHSINKNKSVEASGQLIDNSAQVTNIVDVTDMLRDQGAKDRRRAQRVVLSHLISSHVVLPKLGLIQVAIRDIDEGGLAFEMDHFLGVFEKGDQIELRFYLNGQTYFRVNIVVAYSSLDEELGLARHGAKFAADSLNQEALHHFIQFLKTVSVSLKTDRGERVVSNLTS